MTGVLTFFEYIIFSPKFLLKISKLSPDVRTSVFTDDDREDVLKLLAYAYRLQTLKVIIRYDKYETPGLEWLWDIIRYLHSQNENLQIEFTFDLSDDEKTRTCIKQALRTGNITAVNLSVLDISIGDYWYGSKIIFCHIYFE